MVDLKSLAHRIAHTALYTFPQAILHGLDNAIPLIGRIVKTIGNGYHSSWADIGLKPLLLDNGARRRAHAATCAVLERLELLGQTSVDRSLNLIKV